MIEWMNEWIKEWMLNEMVDTESGKKEGSGSERKWVGVVIEETKDNNENENKWINSETLGETETERGNRAGRLTG